MFHLNAQVFLVNEAAELMVVTVMNCLKWHQHYNY